MKLSPQSTKYGTSQSDEYQLRPQIPQQKAIHHYSPYPQNVIVNINHNPIISKLENLQHKKMLRPPS